MANIATLAKNVDNADQIEAYRARLALSRLEIAAGAAGKAEDRQQLAAELAKIIGDFKEVTDPKKPKDPPKKVPVASIKVRNSLIRNLAGVATAAEVPTLVAALDDFDVREMARWALDRVTSQAAADALAAAATKSVGTEFRVGVVNSLGRKPTASNVVAALKDCCADAEPEVRLAAAEALANHVDPAHDEFLVLAAGKATSVGSRAARRVARARLRLAAGLASAGQKDAARKIYGELASGAADSPQTKAAATALKALS